MNKNEKLNFLYEIATSKNFEKNINNNLKFEDEVKKFYINDDKSNKTKTSEFYRNNLDEK